MTKYSWKSNKSRMLKMLRNSRTLKEKYGWSRKSGASFIKDDIRSVTLNDDKTITINFHFDHIQTFKTTDLNLRETDELIEFLEEQ